MTRQEQYVKAHKKFHNRITGMQVVLFVFFDSFVKKFLHYLDEDMRRVALS